MCTFEGARELVLVAPSAAGAIIIIIIMHENKLRSVWALMGSHMGLSTFLLNLLLYTYVILIRLSLLSDVIHVPVHVAVHCTLYMYTCIPMHDL